MKYSPRCLCFVFGWAGASPAFNSWHNVSISTQSLPLQKPHMASSQDNVLKQDRSRRCSLQRCERSSFTTLSHDSFASTCQLQAVSSKIFKRTKWGANTSQLLLECVKCDIGSYFLGQSAKLSCYVWKRVKWSIFSIQLAHVLLN